MQSGSNAISVASLGYAHLQLPWIIILTQVFSALAPWTSRLWSAAARGLDSAAVATEQLNKPCNCLHT